MQENQTVQKPIQIIPILKESLSLYKANFRLLFFISLLGSSIALTEHLLTMLKVSLGWFGSISLLIGTVVSIWGYTALILAVSERFNGRDVDIKEAFILTKNKIGRFIGVSIFCFLLLIVGSLLLILPGMYWGTIFALAGLVVVLEDTAFFDSFKRSKTLIQGNFWRLFFLYLIFLIIFVPTMFIYKLDIPTIAKTIATFFLSVLYVPWGIALDVNIYNRLKRAKGDIEHSDSEEVKKGGGCLGCLGMIGLGIAIMILGGIWFKNLGGFIKTDKGSKAYEWVAKQFSPKLMKFEDGVTLERPDGYMVVGGQYDDTTYVLYGFPNKKFFSASIFSIPIEKLGISSLQLDNDEIWEKYYAYLNKQSTYNEMKFKNMEKKSLKIVNIAGRPWAEYVLKEKEREYAKSLKVWVYNYTLSDSDVIFVTHGYALKDDEEPVSKLDEIKRIISGFNF